MSYRGNAHPGMAVALGIIALVLLLALLFWYAGGCLGYWPYPQAFTHR